eukprot:13587695-Heterocapsa_arctica.AAC.1
MRITRNNAGGLAPRPPRTYSKRHRGLQQSAQVVPHTLARAPSPAAQRGRTCGRLSAAQHGPPPRTHRR